MIYYFDAMYGLHLFWYTDNDYSYAHLYIIYYVSSFIFSAWEGIFYDYL